MKKLMGLAMLAGAAVAGTTGAAHAEGAWSGNVALTTDYIFRGLSQTDSGPAVQGGFDYTNGIFYAGTWASSVGFTNGTELDLYAGVTPTVGPFALDFAVLGYFYPAAADEAGGVGEFDYYEAMASASFSPMEPLTLGASVYYSPENFAETGEALYAEISAEYALSDALSISGAYGSQTIDDTDGIGADTTGDSYSTWNLGVGYSLAGFGFDLRYSDTDNDSDSGLIIDGYTTEASSEEAFTFTISRAL